MKCLILCFLCSCHCWSINFDNHVLVHGSLLNSINNDVENKFCLELYSKGGSLNNNIKAFKVAYYCQREVDNEQAVKIFANVLDIFYENYNSNSEIRKYLDVYPFPKSRIWLSIRYEKNNLPGEITLIRSAMETVIIEYLDENGRHAEKRLSYEDLKCIKGDCLKSS